MEWKGSPNYWTGRKGHKPRGIVVHTAEGSASGTNSWFLSSKSWASAHYLVTKEGRILQYVKEENTAWHAGIVEKPTWKLIIPNTNPNLYTIGIEFEGKTPEPFTAWQYEAGAKLIAEIAKRWQIPLDRDHIIRHHEIRASKSCPGNRVIMDLLIGLARIEAKRL